MKYIKFSRRIIVVAALGIMGGCGSNGNGMANGTANPVSVWFTSWIMNTTDETAAVIKNTDGSPIAVNIQTVKSVIVTTNGVSESFVEVQASGIPNYQTVLNQADIDALNARPNALTDFSGGSTSAVVGQTVKFGEDIGFISSNACTLNEGAGYWPPGPVCPTNQSYKSTFPTSPQLSSTVCKTGLGVIGRCVNGPSIYNWSDGQTFNNEGVWSNSAAVAEQYDVDICGGHAAQGDYHHHFYSPCWAKMAGDTGVGHSPIYGFAADGYPIYGPWEDTGLLATSAWKTRNYESLTSVTGCGAVGLRTCLLIDQLDPSQGTVTTTKAGPSTATTVTTMSGHSIVAASGYFYEDYYFDKASAHQGAESLDEYNGHTDAERGYHYHLTAVKNNKGGLTPAFPYIIGPTFAGVLPDNAVATCSTGQNTPPNGAPAP